MIRGRDSSFHSLFLFLIIHFSQFFPLRWNWEHWIGITLKRITNPFQVTLTFDVIREGKVRHLFALKSVCMLVLKFFVFPLRNGWWGKCGYWRGLLCLSERPTWCKFHHLWALFSNFASYFYSINYRNAFKSLEHFSLSFFSYLPFDVVSHLLIWEVIVVCNCSLKLTNSDHLSNTLVFLSP